MKKEIYAQDIESIFDLETELFPCLVDMRFLGVRVDVEAAHELKDKLSSEEKECLQKVKKETGVDTQIWAARSIAQVLKNFAYHLTEPKKQILHHLQKNFLQNHPHPVVKQLHELEK